MSKKPSVGRNLLIERLLSKWTKPMTMPQMCKKTGLSEPTVWRYVHRMLEVHPGPLPRQAHIAEWKRTHWAQVAVYARGPGIDAIKPPMLTGAQASSRNYRKERENELREKAEIQTRREWMNEPVRRDPLTTAFFGESHAR